MLSLLTMLLLQGQLFTLRLSQNGSFPRPLKGAEEEEYIRRAAAGELEARNKLVEHNLRLVAHIAKKYYSQTGDADDLISIGTIGLIKAVNTYQPGRKIKLGTYAARCIENAILSPKRFHRPQNITGGVWSQSRDWTSPITDTPAIRCGLWREWWEIRLHMHRSSSAVSA